MAAGGAIGPGTRLGRWHVEGVLGRGGMGVVYRARDDAGRAVALKVLAPEVARDRSLVARVSREASAAARVSHPNIARLIESAEVDGVPILAFELIPGGSLEDALRRAGPLPWREAARLAAGIARALEAAHAAGLVHRDVKPANVLLDERGEPRLADFGLVKSEQDTTRLTATGEMVGTPAYMAPEQADGARELDARADVYGLGGTLYALLAGAPPFTGPHVSLLKQILLERPRPVRELVPDVPPALDALVARLLAKDPRERGDASAAARELETIARGGERDARGSRFLAAFIALGVLALAGAAVAFVARSRAPAAVPSPSAQTPSPAPSARRSAQPTPTPAPSPSRAATRTPTPSPWAPAVWDMKPSERLTDETKAFRGGGPQDRFRLVRQWGDYQWKLSREITGVAVSPAGDVLYSAAGLEGVLAAWDPREGRQLWARSFGEACFAFALSPDGRRAVVGGRRVYLCDTRDPAAEPQTVDLPTEGVVRGLAFSPDGRGLVASIASDRERDTSWGGLGTWSLEGVSPRASAFKHLPRMARSVAYVSSAQIVATCSDGRLRALDATTLELRGELVVQQENASVSQDEDGDQDDTPIVALSHDRRLAITGGANREAQLWQTQELGRGTWNRLEVRDQFPADFPDLVRAAAFSPDGTRAAVASQDGTVRIFELDAEQRPRHHVDVNEPDLWAWALAFSRDGKRLFAGTYAFTDVYDVTDLENPVRLNHGKAALSSRVRSLVALEDDEFVTASPVDRDVKLWRLDAKSPLATSEGLIAPVRALGVHGGHLFAGVQNAVEELTLPGFDAYGRHIPAESALGWSDILVALSPECDVSAVADQRDAGPSSHLVISRVVTGDILATPDERWPISAVAIGSTGAAREILTAHREDERDESRSKLFVRMLGESTLDETRSLAKTRSVDVKLRDVFALAVSPDGRTAFVGGVRGAEDAMYLLALDTLKLEPIGAPWHAVYSAAFSPDGKILAASDDSGQVFLWSLEAGTRRATRFATIDLSSTHDWSRGLAWMSHRRVLLVGTERGLIYAFEVVPP